MRVDDNRFYCHPLSGLPVSSDHLACTGGSRLCGNTGGPLGPPAPVWSLAQLLHDFHVAKVVGFVSRPGDPEANRGHLSPLSPTAEGIGQFPNNLLQAPRFHFLALLLQSVPVITPLHTRTPHSPGNGAMIMLHGYAFGPHGRYRNDLPRSTMWQPWGTRPQVRSCLDGKGHRI